MKRKGQRNKRQFMDPLPSSRRQDSSFLHKEQAHALKWGLIVLRILLKKYSREAAQMANQAGVIRILGKECLRVQFDTKNGPIKFENMCSTNAS